MAELASAPAVLVGVGGSALSLAAVELAVRVAVVRPRQPGSSMSLIGRRGVGLASGA